jgi:RNA-directed DNA polymerase
VSRWSRLTQTSAPKDKLDVVVDAQAAAGAEAGAAVVNGPEGGTRQERTPTRGVSMRQARENVRRLRQRIFKAAQAGDHKKVRSLQKLMLRSHSNTLVSVERVTELNAGRETAGVDGQVALTGEDRTALIERVQREGRSWQPLPVKRTYIPKAGAKLRPLGIPTGTANCAVALVARGFGIVRHAHAPVSSAGWAAVAGVVRAAVGRWVGIQL